MEIGKKNFFLNNHFVKNFHCEEFDVTCKCLMIMLRCML